MRGSEKEVAVHPSHPPDAYQEISVVEFWSRLHELVYLWEPFHKPEFWLRVERTMSDFGERWDWLARHGGRLVAL